MAKRKNKWIQTSDKFSATGPFGRGEVFTRSDIEPSLYLTDYGRFKRAPHKYIVYDLAGKVVREGELGTFHSARLMAGQLILGYDRLAPRAKNNDYIKQRKAEPDTLHATQDQFSILIAVLERIASALEARPTLYDK